MCYWKHFPIMFLFILFLCSALVSFRVIQLLLSNVEFFPFVPHYSNNQNTFKNSCLVLHQISNIFVAQETFASNTRQPLLIHFINDGQFCSIMSFQLPNQNYHIWIRVRVTQKPENSLAFQVFFKITLDVLSAYIKIVYWDIGYITFFPPLLVFWSHVPASF